MPKALITGVTGQDGSYLAEFLLEKGYQVVGMYRHRSTDPFQNVQHLLDKINVVCGDLQSPVSIDRIVRETKPDEVYNIAAMSFVAESFRQPELTRDINFHGVDRILHAVREHAPEAKVYQASTSEMYGNTTECPQNEKTPFKPVSPYGESKVAAHTELIRAYREDGLFVCGGILFNHESPRRGLHFVTRKITRCIAKMAKGEDNVLVLGNLDAKRDWGYAGDYVEAMWMMLQQQEPGDYVIATGENHSVKDFVDAAFEVAGLSYDGPLLLHQDHNASQADEMIRGLRKIKGKKYVVAHPKFCRPRDVSELRGDSSKAREKLGWKPRVPFEELVEMMVKHDMRLLGVSRP